MAHQSLPNTFYYLIIFCGMLLMFTERVWHIMLIYLFDQRARRKLVGSFSFYFALLVGLTASLFALIAVFGHYGFHRTWIGLNEMYAADHFFGGALWAVMVIHLITAPAMIAFIVYYCTPHGRRI